jgi:hypothetical protein
MKEFLRHIAPVISMISLAIVILIATRKHKPWSELTAKEKMSRIALVSAGFLLPVAGVVIAFLT